MNFAHPTPDGPIRPIEQVAIKLTDPVPDGPADIIPGLVPRAGQLVIAGETNVGKSLIALEIASSLTTGQPLWGELKPTLQARRVLYVLGEHYDAVIQRLWQKTQLPMGGEVFLLGPEALGFDKWLVTQARPNLQGISKFKKWAEGMDLIIFDPLSAFLTGGENQENDNITMRLVLDTMSLVSQTSGAVCIVLAHQGKPMMDMRGQEHQRKSYAIRGASAVEDAATNIFYMDRGEKDPASKASGSQMFELKLRKYKGDAPDSYRLLRDQATLTHQLLGNKAYSDVLRIDAQAKVARIQAHNEQIEYRTAIRLAAAVDGVSEETMRRRLGVSST